MNLSESILRLQELFLLDEHLEDYWRGILSSFWIHTELLQYFTRFFCLFLLLVFVSWCVCLESTTSSPPCRSWCLQETDKCICGRVLWSTQTHDWQLITSLWVDLESCPWRQMTLVALNKRLGMRICSSSGYFLSGLNKFHTAEQNKNLFICSFQRDIHHFKSRMLSPRDISVRISLKGKIRWRSARKAVRKVKQSLLDVNVPLLM